jgi:hypothetical protein
MTRSNLSGISTIADQEQVARDTVRARATEVRDHPEVAAVTTAAASVTLTAIRAASVGAISAALAAASPFSPAPRSTADPAARFARSARRIRNLHAGLFEIWLAERA